ncbi:MAG: hypothetical protein M9894_11485 [Planctomycetes bacterium]|nr:hypothetical protein [Planctomycetota bacterium]
MRQASFALGALLALASVASAQSARDLEGLWRRLPAGESGEKFYRLAATSDDALEGALLDPPDGLECHVALKVSGKKLTGAGTWVEGEHRAEAKWELTLDAPGKASGRLEWLDWEDGTIHGRGWEPHRFERVARVGLVTEGDGQAEEPFGDPVDALEPLAGGWAGPGGAWSLEVTGAKRARLVPVGHHDGQTIEVEVQRGVLRGTVAGLGTEVELAWSEGKLDGRAAWTEGQGEVSQRGWAAVTFTRLRRIDGVEGAGAASEPAAGEAAPLDGVWRRDDGLFLRLQPEGGQAVGVLSARDGAVRCRVRLEAKNGRWVGTANWDGVETRWELTASGGGVAGRCEWVDVHDGRVVSRGWAGRVFKPLRRVH